MVGCCRGSGFSPPSLTLSAATAGPCFPANTPAVRPNWRYLKSVCVLMWRALPFCQTDRKEGVLSSAADTLSPQKKTQIRKKMDFLFISCAFRSSNVTKRIYFWGIFNVRFWDRLAWRGYTLQQHPAGQNGDRSPFFSPNLAPNAADMSQVTDCFSRWLTGAQRIQSTFTWSSWLPLTVQYVTYLLN